jgi:hypothetical protein
MIVWYKRETTVNLAMKPGLSKYFLEFKSNTYNL